MILNSIILQAATQPSSDTIFSFWGMVITALATIVVALISSVITSKLNKPKTNAEITKIQAEEINLELDAMMKYQNS